MKMVSSGKVRWLGCLVVAIALGAGCQQARKLSGVRTAVSNPAPESPEGIVHLAIKAAMDKDEEAGWAKFRALLHSKQLTSPASERNWRTMNYSTLRRKVKLYLEDDSTPTYQLCYSEEPRAGTVKVFIANEKNPDNCTPCQVEKDPAAGNAWRIMLCSM